MYVCFFCMTICLPCLPCVVPRRLEESVGTPGTRVTGYELPCGCWDLNPEPLQSVLLTAEPFSQLIPQPKDTIFYSHTQRQGYYQMVHFTLHSCSPLSNRTEWILLAFSDFVSELTRWFLFIYFLELAVWWIKRNCL